MYAYIRKRGSSPENAEDLTQGFFERLVDGQLLRRADPGKGRLRAYLFTCLKNFLAGEHRRSLAERRGGGSDTLSVNHEKGEALLAECGRGDTNPEAVYDRAWARTLLSAVLGDLGETMAAKGKGDLFAALRPTLQWDSPGVSWRGVAEELAMSESSVRVAAHRLRQRYGELLRDRVKQTLADPDEAEAELASLLAAFSEA